MVDDAQKARPHKIDGKTVETKRAMPREVCFICICAEAVTELIAWMGISNAVFYMQFLGMYKGPEF